MKPNDLMKGFLIKPIMEILKTKYGIKSPTPNNLSVTYSNDNWHVIYKGGKIEINFTNDTMIIKIINDIKNDIRYEKVWL